MKLVVITGCLGFIGSQITRDCLENGFKVYGVDSLTYAANTGLLEIFLQNKNFKFCKEDIADLENIPDCDFVVNTAAETHVGNSIIDSTNFIKSNIIGVQNILNLIRRKPSNVSNPPRLIHFSTDEVYGDLTSGSHTETDLLNPSNPYSASKASADLLIKSWARTYNIQYNILRPTNNYGEYQYPEKLIPLAVKLLQRNLKIRLHDHGEPIRTWLHAKDTSSAVMTVMEKGKANEIYNISGGFEQKNIETVKKIINSYDDNLDWKEHIDLNHERPGQDVRYSLDDSKLRELGWKPKCVFDEQISSIVEFYKNNFIW
jgi:dTDP-glucose 4,6-dehydratase